MSRTRIGLAVASVALVALAGWALFSRGEAAEAVQAAAPAASTVAMAPAPARENRPPPAPFSEAGQQTREAKLALWTGRLARAEETLTGYKTSTRYPFNARPAAEHPDQLRPFDPVNESRPLRMPGREPAPGVQVRTTQDRIFASGNESVRFSVRAVDERGQPLKLTVTRASAFDMPDPRQVAGRPQAALNFVPAEDGSLTAQLQPATQGFADFSGTIRSQVELNQDGRTGTVIFDVVYHPLVPAEWAGSREAMESGSLVFYLKAKVAQAGRYVVSGRVDDATGKTFALVSFNAEVPEGAQEFRLPLFGKLVRDSAPAFPLTLRDVQGFLLLPDHFPDRAMLPRLAGVAHTSQSYPLASFSDAEWQSEERSRYLTELTKDVDEAQRQVDALRP